MSATAFAEPRASTHGRRKLAQQRLRAARESLADCQLCAHHCGVNRLTSTRGRCGAGSEGRVFSAQVEVSDELEFIPCFAIALSGCDLRCAFCITGAQSWNPKAGEPLDAPALAVRAQRALEKGARSIMILGGEPTIHLPSVLELVSALPADATLIWKTNGHASALARRFLADLFDVWLVDYKFGNDDCAHRLARIHGYTSALQENLAWAAENSTLVIRHLLMPGHVDCCWRPAAAWIGNHLPGVRVNLRAGFWPAWQARRHAELCDPAPSADVQRAWDTARDAGLHLIE
ncbi:MAG: radical SAM protein [Chthoniobacteraceae bacterium]